jgi:DNA-binding CsgD family transcriptional regulator
MDSGGYVHGAPLELAELSAREREVLEAALAGLSAREIASKFSITEPTVRSHLSSIYGKLGVRGRVELLARFNGVLNQPASQAPPASGRPRRILRNWRRPRLVATVVAAGTIAASCLVLAIWRPDLPPRTSLSTVAQLLAQRKVARLDLSGSDLTVTKIDGQLLLVQDVSRHAWESLGAAKLAYPGSGLSITAHTGGPTTLDNALVAASALLPIALAGALFVALIRWLRRRGPPVSLAK